MTNKRYKILHLIHIPPPVHGVSVICEQVYMNDFLTLPVDKSLVKLNLSRSFTELRTFSLFKIIRLFSIGFRLTYKLIFNRPDLVYFSIMPVGKGFIKDFFLVIILKIFRTDIIYHLHNKGIPHYEKKRLYQSIYNYVFSNCAIIHLSVQLVQTELIKIRHHNKIKIFVVPNGINPIKPFSGFNKNQIITVLFFSNLIPDKGYLASLKAIKILLNRKEKNFRFIIAGSPTNTSNKSIRYFLDNNPEINDYVDIRGAAGKEDKARLFHSADIFIFPSRFTQECMPLVILEAMSVGMPVIGSDIGAIPDMIYNNKNGFLIPPGNAEILAGKIEFFLNNQKLIQQFGNESFKLFNERFTLDHFMQNMENVFKKVLNKKK